MEDNNYVNREENDLSETSAYPGYLLYCEVADMVQSIRYQMKRIDSLG